MVFSQNIKILTLTKDSTTPNVSV